jgi:hypothetical protein
MKRFVLLSIFVFFATTAGAQNTDSTSKPKVIRLRCSASVIPDSLMPLYIGDGKILTKTQITGINPNHILKISVMNTPESTALYGARGMRGVIVLEFKKGSFWIPVEKILLNNNIQMAYHNLPIVYNSNILKSDSMILSAKKIKYHVKRLNSANSKSVRKDISGDYLLITE